MILGISHKGPNTAETAFHLPICDALSRARKLLSLASVKGPSGQVAGIPGPEALQCCEVPGLMRRGRRAAGRRHLRGTAFVTLLPGASSPSSSPVGSGAPGADAQADRLLRRPRGPTTLSSMDPAAPLGSTATQPACSGPPVFGGCSLGSCSRRRTPPPKPIRPEGGLTSDR